MAQFDTFPIQCRHIEHMYEGVWFRKKHFWQNYSCENLDNFSLIMHRWCLNIVYALVPSWAHQLLPQLLMEPHDTLPIQYRLIEHMHEGVWFRKNNFWPNDSCENLDNFSLIMLLYMHRWCLHGPINSYHSFSWSNSILCLFNIDTLNIFMKESGWNFFFDKMTVMRT